MGMTTTQSAIRNGQGRAIPPGIGGRMLILTLVLGVVTLVGLWQPQELWAANVTYYAIPNNGTAVGTNEGSTNAATSGSSTAGNTSTAAWRTLFSGSQSASSFNLRITAANAGTWYKFIRMYTSPVYGTDTQISGTPSYNVGLRSTSTSDQYRLLLIDFDPAGAAGNGTVITQTASIPSPNTGTYTEVSGSFNAIGSAYTVPAGHRLVTEVQYSAAAGASTGRFSFGNTTAGYNTYVVVDESTCSDGTPSTITIPGGQTGNGDPYNVSGMFTTTGNVGSFEYRVMGATPAPSTPTLYLQGDTTTNLGFDGTANLPTAQSTGTTIPYRGTIVTTPASATSWRPASIATGTKTLIRGYGPVQTTTDVISGVSGNITVRSAATTYVWRLDLYDYDPATGATVRIATSPGGTVATAGSTTGVNPGTFTIENGGTVTVGHRLLMEIVHTSTAASTTERVYYGGTTATTGTWVTYTVTPGPVICTDWTTSASIPASTGNGSLCGNYTDGGTYTLDVRGTDPDCGGSSVTTTPTDFTWNSCSDGTPTSATIPGSQTVGGASVNLTTLYTLNGNGSVTGYTIDGNPEISPWDSTVVPGSDTAPVAVTFCVLWSDPDCGGTSGQNCQSVDVDNTVPPGPVYGTSTCTDCHKAPPGDGTRQSTVGGTVIGGGTTPGSHGPHSAKGYACTVCHVNNTLTSHREGFIEMRVPINGDAGASYSKTASFAQTATPTPLGTCSNVSCHATGLPGATVPAPQWGGGPSACNWCHGNPPTTSLLFNHGGVSAGVCDACHPHNGSGVEHQDGTLQASAACSACHDSAQGARRVIFGSDFTASARHVFGGTVSDWDCIVCHGEGNENSPVGAPGFASPEHGDGVVDMRNVDTIGSNYTWRTAAGGRNNTDHTNMDNFCFGCHDSDASRGAGLGGASGIAVNAAGDGVTLAPSAAQKIAPFNPTDALRTAAVDSTGSLKPTAAPERTGVVDVYGQFDTANPSHHAVRGQRYGTHNTSWGAAAWVARPLKNGQTLNTTGNYEAATLHCADCHTVDVNAHNGANPFMMTATTIDGTCYTCHGSTVYTQGTNTASRVNHEFCGNTWGSVASFFGNSRCFQCHGGEPQDTDYSGSVYGGIHGNNYGASNMATGMTARYRFMGGLKGTWSTATTAGGTPNWTGTNTYYCYMQATADSWAGCTRHNGLSGTDSVINWSRAINY